MAKTIRPILCPQCGSPAKTPLGPDRFRCLACQTEYYLDTDNVTITVRQQYLPPPGGLPRQSQALRYGWAGLLLVAVVGVGTWLAVRHSHPDYFGSVSATATKPVFYLTQYLYADDQRQPVYVTLRTEGPRWGSDSTALYADFFDPRTGKLRREQPLAPMGHHRNPLYAWHTFAGNRVYVLGSPRLYRVAQQPDRLVDVTDTLLARFPAASSGVAQVQLDDAHQALEVLTNDGQTIWYLPASGQVLTDGLALYHAAYAHLPRRFLTFEQRGGVDPPASWPRLLVNRPTGQFPAVATTDLTGTRHFFDPHLLYQDAQVLLLDVAPSAQPNGPRLVQCLDAATGRLRWSCPASPYELLAAVRTADGYAVSYRTGPELDYVHGVVLLAEDGRQLRDFQRKRLE